MASGRLPDHGDQRYFTLEGYRKILERAAGRGYRSVAFRDFDGSLSQPTMILRHDLDRPFESALLFGEMEVENGATATYFVQTACDLYNLLSRESRGIIRSLSDMGHEVGLHYEADRYVGEEGRRILEDDLRLIEDLSGARVESASQHIPIDGERIALKDYIENEAYESRFTQAPMTYISDSLMAWRQATPHDLLDQGVSFQFLTHPETWASHFANMEEAMLTMMNNEVAAIRQRYLRMISYYGSLFTEREERDRLFVERQKQPAVELGHG